VEQMIIRGLPLPSKRLFSDLLRLIARCYYTCHANHFWWLFGHAVHPLVKLWWGSFAMLWVLYQGSPAQTGHITYLELTVLLNSISLMLSQTAT